MIPLAIPAIISAAAAIVPDIVKLAVGDRAGRVAEAVGSAATAIFGTDDPAQVKAQIGLDPEKAQQFKIELLRITVEQERVIREDETRRILAEHADRQNARQQTVDLTKTGSPIAWGAVVVSAIVLASYALAVWMSMTFEVPASQKDNVAGILWTLNAMAVSVVGFWVGSSASSFRKDALLQKKID